MDTGNLVNTTLGYDVSTISPFPLALDAVNVSFDVPSAGISVAAPIVAVSQNQINVQCPGSCRGRHRLKSSHHRRRVRNPYLQ